MKHLLILASILLAGGFAQAQDARSEFFYQASEGESFVQGNIQHAKVTHESESGEELELSDLDLQIAYEMGLNEMIALYGNIGYGQGKWEVGPLSRESDGLNPINFGAKLRMAAGPGQFFGRANLGLGLLADRDCEASGAPIPTKIECNRTDESISLALRLGYLMSYDTAFSGIAFDLGLFSTDGKDGDNDFDRKGGWALTAFYEMLMLDMIFGGALSYENVGMFGTYSPDGVFYEDSADDFSFLGLKLYTRVPMAEGMSFLAGLKYDFMVNSDADDHDDGSGMGINVGLRMAL